MAAKRASKEANEGKIDAVVSADNQQAAMIEVNCETDFVTRNDDFQAFVAELINESLQHESGTMADAVADKLEEKIAQVGEKISLRRNENGASKVQELLLHTSIWVAKWAYFSNCLVKKQKVFQRRIFKS